MRSDSPEDAIKKAGRAVHNMEHGGSVEGINQRQVAEARVYLVEALVHAIRRLALTVALAAIAITLSILLLVFWSGTV